MFKVFGRLLQESEQEKIAKANMKKCQELQAKVLKYNELIYNLNKVINKKYQLVLLEESIDDVKCNWRTALLYEVFGSKQCKVYIQLDRPLIEHLSMVCDFINILEREGKIKMTREEAKIKVQALFHSGRTKRDIDDFIDALEALGLIKFDEPKKEVYVFKNNCGVEYTILDKFIRKELK